jgi:formate dehydrogenase iron-sulfur subunit
VTKAGKRVAALKDMGYKEAQLYGADSNGPLGGLNAFFLLLDKPTTYALPEKPALPQRNVIVDSLLSIGSALLVGVGALLAFRQRGGADGGVVKAGAVKADDAKDGGHA